MSDISMSGPEPELKLEHVPAPAKKPAAPKDPSKPGAVVGKDATDPVLFSRAVYKNPRTRKSLTVHHLQRRLADLGYKEAASDRDGLLGDRTTAAISAWQEDAGHLATGYLTPSEFEAIFKGDVNVSVVLD